MLGAIAGDIIGSRFEHESTKNKDFKLFDKWSHFTDDTILTVAIAYALLENIGYAQSLKWLGSRYEAGYGASFYAWLVTDSLAPYNSWGNGSAMRVSPVAYAFNSVDEVLQHAKNSAEVTHNHPEGIIGAQAVALAIFLARTGSSKQAIKADISSRFDYDLDRTLADIRPDYAFEVSCAKSVPESIICFLEADNYEETVRNAVSLGGDSDTMACIAGSIAEAFYGGIPDEIAEEVYSRLPSEFIDILGRFYQKYEYSFSGYKIAPRKKSLGSRIRKSVSGLFFR